MTDPILYEPSIMQTLDCAAEVDNVQRLQAACMLSLVDAYDRKLTRDEFIVLCDAAVTLHTQMGKLYMIDSISNNYKFGHLDGPMIERAEAGLNISCTATHAELHRLMKRIVSCPTSEDQVH